MPELPEVETVCRSLNQKIFEVSKKPRLTNIHLWRKDLRFKIPAADIKKQFDQVILGIHRRVRIQKLKATWAKRKEILKKK